MIRCMSLVKPFAKKKSRKPGTQMKKAHPTGLQTALCRIKESKPLHRANGEKKDVTLAAQLTFPKACCKTLEERLARRHLT
jgi:hypothetical protein